MRNRKEAQVVRLTELFWNQVSQRLDDDDIRGQEGWSRLRGAIVDGAWKAAKEMEAPCDEGLLASANGRASIVPEGLGVCQTHIRLIGDDGRCEFREAICGHNEQVVVKIFRRGKDAEA